MVQVAAFAQDGVAGPVSPPSDADHVRLERRLRRLRLRAAVGPPPPPPAPEPAPAARALAVARDFNGDGTADLVVADRLERADLGDAGRQRDASEIPLPAAPTGARVVGTGDYDGNADRRPALGERRRPARSRSGG